VGPEGLSAVNGGLWTVTEVRNHRTVFGKPFASLLK
jgi:hypothetical protein